MIDPRQHAELLELLAKLRDDLLTQPEAARIEQLVRGGAAACELYLNYVRMHVDLSCYAANLPPSAPPVAPVASRATILPPLAQDAWRYANRPHVFGLFFASVFMLAALTLLRVFPVASPSDGGEATAPADERFIARLTNCQEVAWQDASVALEAGMHLRPGTRLHLASGLATVALKNQTQIVLEGPTELVLISPSQARLSRGRVVARVSMAARGFTLDTPQARVIDLGTEFGVDVDDQEQTHVQVFTGEVRIEHFEQAASRRVVSGQTAEIDAERIAVSAASAATRFASLRTSTNSPGEVVDLDFSAYLNADVVLNSPLLLDTTQSAIDASSFCFATQTAAEQLGVPSFARGLPDDGRFPPDAQRDFAVQLAFRNDRDKDNALRGRGPNLDWSLDFATGQRRAYESLHLFLTIGNGDLENRLTITLLYADGAVICEQNVPDWGLEPAAPTYVLTRVDRFQPDGQGSDPQMDNWRIFGLPLPVDSRRVLIGLRVQSSADGGGVFNLFGATGRAVATPVEPTFVEPEQLEISR